MLFVSREKQDASPLSSGLRDREGGSKSLAFRPGCSPPTLSLGWCSHFMQRRRRHMTGSLRGAPLPREKSEPCARRAPELATWRKGDSGHQPVLQGPGLCARRTVTLPSRSIRWRQCRLPTPAREGTAAPLSRHVHGLGKNSPLWQEALEFLGGCLPGRLAVRGGGSCVDPSREAERLSWSPVWTVPQLRPFSLPPRWLLRGTPW